MSSKKTFQDNSSIDWLDKETLLYSKDGYSAYLWIDFEPGFFKRGRVIKVSSLKEWESCPSNISEMITNDDKTEIIEKAKDYLSSLNKKFRIEK